MKIVVDKQIIKDSSFVRKRWNSFGKIEIKKRETEREKPYKDCFVEKYQVLSIRCRSTALCILGLKLFSLLLLQFFLHHLLLAFISLTLLFLYNFTGNNHILPDIFFHFIFYLNHAQFYSSSEASYHCNSHITYIKKYIFHLNRFWMFFFSFDSPVHF